MLKTMTAKFSSTCSRTGQRIQRGQTIVYDTVKRTASLLNFDGFEGRENAAGDYIRLWRRLQLVTQHTDHDHPIRNFSRFGG